MQLRMAQSLRETVGAAQASGTFRPHDADVLDALELLGWLVAKGYLEVKVAIPCDSQRQPIHSTTLFHEKAGIIEDEGGNLLAFNGSINETVAGWRHNWDSFHVYTSWTGTAEHVLARSGVFKCSGQTGNQGRYCRRAPGRT
jgi:hypothetical protein